MSLVLTHLIFLFSIATSTAIAAPLCSELLLPSVDKKLMEVTLDDLAKMKFEIDLKKLQGESNPADRHFEEQYLAKKLELQKHFKLSDQEIANILREKISRKQSSGKEVTAKEKQRERQTRAQEDKIINPWIKTRTIELPESIVQVEAKYTSEKHQVALHLFDHMPHELALIDFITGKTTNYTNSSTITDLLVPRGSDIVILTTPEGLTTFNLVSKRFDPWNKVNEWRNTANGSNKPIQNQISTMTPDQKHLVHVIFKGNTTFAALIEIATGKIVLTKELEHNNQFFQNAIMLNATKLALSSAQGLYVFDLGKKSYFAASIESKMETLARTDNKRALIGSHNGFTYRFDLANHNETKSQTWAQEHIVVDSDYVWRLDSNGILERLRVHDLSVVNNPEPPAETQYFPRVYPLKPGLIVGMNHKDEIPLAIYDSHSLQPIFDFHGQFMDKAIVLTSVAVLRDGTQILIEYYINDQQQLEIWDLNQ